MKVTIGDHIYDWDGDYTFQEGVAIERETGMPFIEWLETMRQGTGRITDIGVLLWIVARREQPDLKFDDFDFPLDQWAMESDDPPTEASSSDEPTT